ncbi:MAG: hypothetical protein ABI863_12300 [Ginsengibacter sp.]
MKTFKILLIVIIATLTFQITYAQSDKTQRTVGIKIETIKVSGTCSMDKQRVEHAAYSIKGVKFAFFG